MDWTNWITAISAMIAAVAVACTAYFAKQGMNVWREQIRGKDEYKLARNLLASIYKHRDAMHDARHWLMTIVDKPTREEAEEMTSEQAKFYGLSRAYSRRWKKIEKEHQKIYRDLILAEAIWGDELRDLLGSILEPEQDLRVAIDTNLWLRNPANDVSRGEDWGKDLEELRSTLYGEPGDGFGQKIENGIKPAELYLKKKLRKSLRLLPDPPQFAATPRNVPAVPARQFPASAWRSGRWCWRRTDRSSRSPRG